MMTPEQAKQCLLTSDYPLDKVIGFDSGSISIPVGAVPVVTSNHGFSFTPLALTTYSLDSDFSLSKDEGLMPYANPNTQVGVTSYTDATNLNIHGFNNTGSTKVVYWRTYYLAPSNVAGANITFTDIASNDFVFNTDFNYTKLYMSGIVNGNATISHGLGYKPQAIIWYSVSSLGLTRLTGGSANADAIGYINSARVSNSDIKLDFLGQVHYRIYIDE